MSDHESSGYTSSSGFLMRGGQERIPPRTKEFAWISLGLMVGVVLIIAIAV